MNRELTVIRSNDLVESSYKISLDERRLIECGIAKIKSGEPIPDKIKITAEEFGEAWGITTRSAYKQLKAATKNLYEQDIFMFKEGKRGEQKWHYRWVDSCGYEEGEGCVYLSFTKWIKPYLQELSSAYTSYRLFEIKHLKSSHAMRLYELMMQYRKTGFKVDSLDNLKRYFGVEDKYKRWVDFDKRVLRAAVKEINNCTAYQVKHKPLKKGRKVDAVQFSFSPKHQKMLEL